MSAPHLLLVDDSEAILAYERAVLSGLYTLSSATHGKDALRAISTARPDCVLLDLSMPEMTGDEVLDRMRADPTMQDIPVIIVSSEAERAAACLAKGASFYVAKPIRAQELKDAVAAVLAHSRQRRSDGAWSVLPVEVGPATLALPLSCVNRVCLQPATETLPTGPSYLREIINLHGQPVCVLDLAGPLRVESSVPRVDRKLVVIEHDGLSLALGVDRVHDPVEYPADAVTVRERLAGKDPRLVASALAAVVRRPEGLLSVVDPAAFFSRRLVQSLRHLLERIEPEKAEG